MTQAEFSARLLALIAEAQEGSLDLRMIAAELEDATAAVDEALSPR